MVAHRLSGATTVPANRGLRAILERVANGAQSNVVFNLTLWVVYALILVIFTLPYFWMIISSFRPDAEIFQFTYPLQWHTFVPVVVTLQSYVDMLGPLAFGRNILNSLFVALATVILSLIVNSMAAYPLARLRFRGQKIILAAAFIIMTVPLEATIIPLYIAVRDLNLQNTYTALILPWIARPFDILLLRQFFLEIPQALEDAALVDGCSRPRIYWNILLPNIRPALITCALFDFLLSWDQFFWPLVVIQSPRLQVVQVIIASLNEPDAMYWGRTFAACTMVSLPIIVVFLSLQRYYVRGAILSGIKG